MSQGAHLAFALYFEAPADEAGLLDLTLDVVLPQLAVFRRLEANALPFDLALCLPPQLLHQLAALRSLEAALFARVDARREAARRASKGASEEAARFDLEQLEEAVGLLEVLNFDVLAEYRRLREAGFLELVASTDGYLPLLGEGAALEIEAAVATFEAHLDVTPEGIYPHGAGYTPGLERWMRAADLRYLITAPGAVERAAGKPLYGRFAPVLCEAAPEIMAFPTDPESLGCLCEGARHLEYRLVGGLSPFFRVTGSERFKAFYNPDRALEQVEGHARCFLKARLAQAEALSEHMDRPPLMFAALPAALFGGQWREGPQFLEALFEVIYVEGEGLSLMTPSRYLAEERRHQILRLAPASALEPRALCNQKNNWIYPRLHAATRALSAFAAGDDVDPHALEDAKARLLEAQRACWAERMNAAAGEAAAGAADRIRATLSALDDLIQSKETR